MVLIVALLIAAGLGLFLRIRASLRERARVRAAFQAELERDLREL